MPLFAKTDSPPSSFSEMQGNRTSIGSDTGDKSDDSMITSPSRESKMANASALFPTYDDNINTHDKDSLGGNSNKENMDGDDDDGPNLPSLLRFSFPNEADDSSKTSGNIPGLPMPATSPYPHRKRPNAHLSNRDHPLEDSDEEMFSSPRASPTYRTMDGRMVTSKNPFSPYTPDTMVDASSTNPSLGKTPPVFPLTLSSSASSSSSAVGNSRLGVAQLPGLYGQGASKNREGISTAAVAAGAAAAATAATATASDDSAGGSTPVKINLRRRDNTAMTPFRSNYFCVARSGYPSRSGQYSFTGSPIEEIDLPPGVANSPTSRPALSDVDPSDTVGRKVRKLHIDDNVRSGDSRRSNRLFIDTQEANTTYNSGYRHHTSAADEGMGDGKGMSYAQDKVSPTDVMSFPPPTPSKASRAVSGYTPLGSAVPRTPVLDRRTSSRRPFISDDESDDMMGLGGETTKQRKSRFQEDFDVIGQLGDGSFGTVYKCLSRLDGCMYAVKAAKRKAKGIADRDRMLKEVYALAALSDQADTAAFHIVRYHQAWMDENRLYIQTELCSSTLQTEMESNALTEPRRYKLLREILLALEFIHRNNMVHLDIKVRDTNDMTLTMTYMLSSVWVDESPSFCFAIPSSISHTLWFHHNLPFVCLYPTLHDLSLSLSLSHSRSLLWSSSYFLLLCSLLSLSVPPFSSLARKHLHQE